MTDYAISKIQVDVDKLEEKATTFVREGKHPDEVFSYIKGVLVDSNFQQNPTLYMNKWKEKRGFTEVWRMPEDPAYAFFEQELYR